MSAGSSVLAALLVVIVSSPAIAAEAASPASTSAPEVRPSPGPNEPYLTTGFTYFAASRRVVAGLGGGPGYRLHLTPHVAVHAEFRYLVFVGNAFTAAFGGTYELTIGPLEPQAGIQLAVYAGDRVTVISTANPVPPPPLAWAGQLRLAPFRFTQEHFTVTTLSGDVGLGVDAGSRALALTISLLDIGVRF